jgi:hypothetical protein
MSNENEIVIGKLTKKQRAAIKRIEAIEPAPMFMHCASLAIHYIAPKTGKEHKFELHVAAVEGAYKATIIDALKPEVIVGPFDPDERILRLFKLASPTIGEHISRARRS